MDYRLTATLLDSLGIALCVFDDQHRTVLWNQSFLRFFPEHDGHVYAGEAYADNLRRFYRQRLAPQELLYLERHVADGVARHAAQTRPYVFQHRGRWLRVAAPAAASDGHRVRVWLELAESGVRTPTLAPTPPADRHSSDALQMLEHAGDGASVQSGDGRIVFASDHFLAMYGLPTKTAAIGRTYTEVVHGLWDHARATPEHAARAEDIAAALNDSLHFAGAPFEVPLPGGRWVRVATSRMADGQTCAFHTDISSDKQRQSELRALTDQLREESQHDALTGLQNRRGLHAIVQTLSGQPGPHALLFLDLDGFKAVNDAAGHGAGDQVLRQVAEVLRRSVRQADTLVRIGGDEFVVVLKSSDTHQALAVGDKIVQAIRQQVFSAEGANFHIGASVGVRIFSGHSDSPDVVLHDADVACYRAKRNGRGRVEVFGTGG